jgi:hypothetical protein
MRKFLVSAFLAKVRRTLSPSISVRDAWLTSASHERMEAIRAAELGQRRTRYLETWLSVHSWEGSS